MIWLTLNTNGHDRLFPVKEKEHRIVYGRSQIRVCRLDGKGTEWIWA